MGANPWIPPSPPPLVLLHLHLLLLLLSQLLFFFSHVIILLFACTDEIFRARKTHSKLHTVNTSDKYVRRFRFKLSSAWFMEERLQQVIFWAEQVFGGFQEGCVKRAMPISTLQLLSIHDTLTFPCKSRVNCDHYATFFIIMYFNNRKVNINQIIYSDLPSQKHEVNEIRNDEIEANQIQNITSDILPEKITSTDFKETISSVALGEICIWLALTKYWSSAQTNKKATVINFERLWCIKKKKKDGRQMMDFLCLLGGYFSKNTPHWLPRTKQGQIFCYLSRKADSSLGNYSFQRTKCCIKTRFPD